MDYRGRHGWRVLRSLDAVVRGRLEDRAGSGRLRPADQLVRAPARGRGSRPCRSLAPPRRLGEHRACLLAHLAARIARGEVGEQQHPRLRATRQLRRLARRAVARLARPLGLLLGERRLVHQHIRLVRRDRQRLARGGVAGDHHLAALARRGPPPARAPPRSRSPRAPAARSPAPASRPTARRAPGPVPRAGILHDHVPHRRGAAVAAPAPPPPGSPRARPPAPAASSTTLSSYGSRRP